MFDYLITHYLFTLGQTLPPFVVSFFATILIWIIICMVVLLSRRYAHNQTAVIMQALFAAGLSYIISTIIGYVYFRARPFVAFDFEPLVHIAPSIKSFPSDHTTISFALATTIWVYHKRWGALAVGLGLLVGIGRMLAGVHYATDIAGGIVVGTIGAYVIHLLWQRIPQCKRWRV